MGFTGLVGTELPWGHWLFIFRWAEDGGVEAVCCLGLEIGFDAGCNAVYGVLIGGAFALGQ
jgi:hypothetical protein